MYILFYMSRLSGVHIQSQAAYELAVQGLIRPANNNIPMIYTIKCIDFNSPEFTLGKCLLCLSHIYKMEIINLY